jgi:hypothetical protein
VKYSKSQSSKRWKVAIRYISRQTLDISTCDQNGEATQKKKTTSLENRDVLFSHKKTNERRPNQQESIRYENIENSKKSNRRKK